MNIPEELRYTPDHEWVRFEEGGGTAVVGITAFAQDQLGDVVFVEIESVDSDIDRNEPFGTIEAVKTVSELFMPFSGRIVAVNEELDEHPEYVNEDPYGKGWMIRVALADPSGEGELLSAEAYGQLIG